MSVIIVCPNRKEYATSKDLRARGFLLINVRGSKRMLVVAHRVSRVVQMPRRSVVEQILEFARRP